jgi:hypothetical protein
MMQLQYSECSNANALHSLVPRPAVLGPQFPAPDLNQIPGPFQRGPRHHSITFRLRLFSACCFCAAEEEVGLAYRIIPYCKRVTKIDRR